MVETRLLKEPVFEPLQEERADPDLVADVRSLPLLPDGFYEEVLAQDILEHLTREDAPVALREWRRVMNRDRVELAVRH